MRLLVFGGRNYSNKAELYHVLDSMVAAGAGPSALISGAAWGADRLAWDWALDRDVFWVLHPADWDQHGRSAGPKRNRAMFNQWAPTHALGFPGGVGSADMARVAADGGATVWCVP